MRFVCGGPLIDQSMASTQIRSWLVWQRLGVAAQDALRMDCAPRNVHKTLESQSFCVDKDAHYGAAAQPLKVNHVSMSKHNGIRAQNVADRGCAACQRVPCALSSNGVHNSTSLRVS